MRKNSLNSKVVTGMMVVVFSLLGASVGHAMEAREKMDSIANQDPQNLQIGHGGRRGTPEQMNQIGAPAGPSGGIAAEPACAHKHKWNSDSIPA